MGSMAIDLSAGMVPKSQAPIDLSAGLVPKVQSAAPAEKPGFFSSLADSSGLSALAHPYKNFVAPVAGLVGDALHGRPASDTNPLVQMVQGTVANAKNEGGEALNSAKQGSYLAAGAHLLQATPILGQGMQRAAAQGPGDTGSYLHNLKGLVTNPGAMGTLAGTAATLAAPAASALTKLGGAGLLDSATSAVPTRIAQAVNSIPQLPAVALQKLGVTGQEGGIGLMNRTVGTLKADFKRGADPSRGYFAAGGRPAWSMKGIADQAGAAKAATGADMGALRDEATNAGVRLPTSDVSQIIASPIAKARLLESGPGGVGNLNTINSYAENFQPTFQKAFANPAGMSPNDVFDLKRNIAQNTNWSDPSQFNLKAVRQQQTGALGGLLADTIPGYGDAAKTYGDLGKMATRAQSRAETGSMPLTSLATKAGLGAFGAGVGAFGGAHDAILGGVLGSVLDSVPVTSTAASGMYYGGSALKSLGSRLLSVPTLDGAAIAPAANALKGDTENDNKGKKKQAVQNAVPLRFLPIP